MLPTLDSFISLSPPSGARNSYIQDPEWDQMYVRYGARYIEYPKGSYIKHDLVLTFVRLEVREDLQNTGVFTRLVDKLQTTFPQLDLVVENTHKRFALHLISKGWVDITPVGDIISYSLFLPKKSV